MSETSPAKTELPKTTKRLPGISVFLPCHNEEGNVERVVRNFSVQLPLVADEFEIIVVDDGSRDRTGAIADSLSSADPHIKTVHHPVNRGYGGAVISGAKAASLPYVLLCDGDGQFDPADIVRLAALMPENDIIVGRRINRADPFMRRLNGHAWTFLMRLFFGIRVHDVDCGFKLFKREFIHDLDLRAQGAMISTEILARAASKGARIVEVDVQHLPRLSGEQSGAKLKVIFRAFRELTRLYRELRSKP
jgi:glycosyltransferase involved in cell wall biosynthesis